MAMERARAEEAKLAQLAAEEAKLVPNRLGPRDEPPTPPAMAQAMEVWAAAVVRLEVVVDELRARLAPIRGMEEETGVAGGLPKHVVSSGLTQIHGLFERVNLAGQALTVLLGELEV